MTQAPCQLSASARPLALALGVVLCLFATSGCVDNAHEESLSSFEDALRQAQVQQFAMHSRVRLPEMLAQRAREEAGVPSVVSLLDEVENDNDRHLLRATYTANEGRPLFVTTGGLTALGVRLLSDLDHAWTHGLEGAPYLTDELHAMLESVETGTDLGEAYDKLTPSLENEALLLSWLMERSGPDGVFPPESALVSALLNTSARSPWPNLRDNYGAVVNALQGDAAIAPRLEVELASRFLTYARELRFQHAHRLSDQEYEERDWRRPEESDVLTDTQQNALLEGALASLVEGSGIELLDSLAPAHPQYRALHESVLRYEEMVRAGGWSPIDGRRERRRGYEGDEVVQLRQRLDAEGYLSGSNLSSPLFDRELERDVRRYQRTHQLRENGRLSSETRSSLAYPAHRRLAQILVTLRRWHSSRQLQDGGGEYIWVNIPDFHAELIDGDEQVYRWRVIAGSTTMEEQPNGREELVGRTPLFSDTMLYIVFNPYWNVPESIKLEEYDPLILENPFWPQENNFELYVDERGIEMLRELPGPGNALGQVKFIFPNPHSVYMHDTPTKSLFDEPVRAFSHGCIRVHNPLDLARLLLRRDRGWTERRTEEFVEEQLLTATEQWVTLRNPLPVHLEYYHVRAGESGHVEFLADIYRLDRDEVRRRTAELAERYGAAEPNS